jgi:DNA invertase Pin-like site-specific DNA recombinase
MMRDNTTTQRSRSSKVHPWHLDRLAVVYVRQSSAQQVAENRESAERQYALVDRAVELGWPRDRVLVIDDDQGKSGSTTEGRLGFQRLLAEVGLDHVGLILGIEMSRLARSCKDWHQLLELCAIFRTLLADQDGLYEPTDPNDRLLLGLKGTMSEAELHVLRCRLRQGLLNKVRRGAVFLGPPIGYVRSPHGGFELDPDEQVRAVVHMIFEQFARLGRARKVAMTLIEQDIKIGVRPHSGPNRGQLEWRTAATSTICKILKHPIYAGIYVYGRTQVDPRRRISDGQLPARKRVAPDEYLAYIPGIYPAYITVEQYEANQKKLAENRARHESKGAPREGLSILAGLVRCGRCQRRMVTTYNGSNQRLRYACANQPDVRGICTHAFAGETLDQLVGDQVLLALQPGALELSLAAAEDVIRERAAIDKNWQQRIERVRITATRAERQYQAAEPENRLVARTLERRWEEALLAVRSVEEEYARFQRTQPASLMGREVEQIRALAHDLPALWVAATTRPIDRQQIVRILVEEVEAAVEGTSDRLQVKITWVGGATTDHVTSRRVKRYEQLVNFEQLLARVKEFHTAGKTAEAIAQQLNAEGFHSPYGNRLFLKKNVGNFIRKYIHHVPHAQKRWKQKLKPHEWYRDDLCRHLKIRKGTLHRWISKGWVHYRVLEGPRTHYACWADAAELKRLTELAKTPCHWYDPPLPSRLTTPHRKSKEAPR